MSSLDLVFIGIIVFFALWGWWRGLIHMIGGLILLVVAAWLSGPLSEALATRMTENMNVLEEVVKINWVHNLLFWIVFGVIVLVGNFALFFVNILASLPIISIVKRGGGLLLGLAQGLIVVGLVAIMLSRYPINSDISTMVAESKIVDLAIRIAALGAAFWPKDLKSVADILKK